eukprot:scaffold25038_cov36-Prasinocladus_malaysianus.AAC.1
MFKAAIGNTNVYMNSKIILKYLQAVLRIRLVVFVDDFGAQLQRIDRYTCCTWRPVLRMVKVALRTSRFRLSLTEYSIDASLLQFFAMQVIS